MKVGLELGMEHLIVHLWPPTAAAVTELGHAAMIARSEVGVAAHG